MFPSTNYADNSFEFLLKMSPSLSDYQTPKQDLDASFFLTSLSPFFDENESPLNQILSQNQIMVGGNHHRHVVENLIQKNDSDLNNKKGKSVKRGVVVSGTGDDQAVTGPITRRRNLGVVPRKRTGKKDRHSKICTAQGIRDRRMRLSLQVARKFFDLQDMLGYDKASKTIEWLFTKSKKAIKELVDDGDPIQANNVEICNSEAKSESFVSECEVVSGIEESSNMEVKEGTLPPRNLIPMCISPFETRDHGIKPRKKPVCKPNSVRESRDKARARARCRTREKMIIKGLEFSSQLCKYVNPNHDCSNNPFEGVDQESGSINQQRVFAYEADFTSLEQQLADVGTIEKLLKGSSSSSSRSCPNISDHYNRFPVAVYGCIDSNFMGLISNLDLVNDHSMNSSQYPVTNQVSLAGSSSSSPFEGVDQELDSCKQERVPQFGADVGTIEKLLEINSSSTLICPNGSNNNFMGFLGNWDMLNNIDRLNSSSSDTDHLSLAGNPNSIYSAPVDPN